MWHKFCIGKVSKSHWKLEESVRWKGYQGEYGAAAGGTGLSVQLQWAHRAARHGKALTISGIRATPRVTLSQPWLTWRHSSHWVRKSWELLWGVSLSPPLLPFFTLSPCRGGERVKIVGRVNQAGGNGQKSRDGSRIFLPFTVKSQIDTGLKQLMSQINMLQRPVLSSIRDSSQDSQ